MRTLSLALSLIAVPLAAQEETGRLDAQIGDLEAGFDLLPEYSSWATRNGAPFVTLFYRAEDRATWDQVRTLTLGLHEPTFGAPLRVSELDLPEGDGVRKLTGRAESGLVVEIEVFETDGAALTVSGRLAGPYGLSEDNGRSFPSGPETTVTATFSATVISE